MERLLLGRWYLLWSFAILGTLASGQGQIVINELMFHPKGEPVEDPREEWVELHNLTDTEVDLSGWELTRGVNFIFPDGVAIPAHGYLVVAADLTAFQSLYPEITAIGGWEGRLSNASESIRLRDADGEAIDTVDYATEGEWGLRTIEKVEQDFLGRTWRNLADGGGRTLELIQPHFAINQGQLWTESLTGGGTPGQANSVLEANIAPVITAVSHQPAIPRTGDTVTISARVRDDHDQLGDVTIHYRVFGETPWTPVPAAPMGDDRFEIRITNVPPEGIGEYYVEASDETGNSRTWPAPAREIETGAILPVYGNETNALFQVDDAHALDRWQPGDTPIYLMIMTPDERARLKAAQDASGPRNPVNARFHGTFVSVDGTGVQVIHGMSVRDRGYSSRSGNPVNFNVSFPNDHLWNGRRSMQLNSRYPFSQALGAAMFQLAGLPTTEAVPVRVRVNGTDTADRGTVGYGHYVRAEPMNGDWIERLYPHDPDGNLYRIDDHARLGTGQFTYEGDENDPYNITYLKRTNEDLDDFSDIIALTDALDRAPMESFREEVEKVVNVRQWLRYLAVNTLIANMEGGLATGRADDFGIYRGVNDPRFVLLPHDFDTVMTIGERNFAQEDIFIYRQIDGLERLLGQDRQTIREYYQTYLEMLEGWFRPEIIDPVIDQVIGSWTPEEKVAAAKQFVREHREAISQQIPQTYGVSVDTDSAMEVRGLRVTDGFVWLRGTFHVGDTGAIFVNGRAAEISYGESRGNAGTWEYVVPETHLRPGINAFEIAYHRGEDSSSERVHTDQLEVYFRSPAQEISGDITATATESEGELVVAMPNNIEMGRPFPVRVQRLKEGSRLQAHPAWEVARLTSAIPGVTFQPSAIVLENGLGTALVTARVPDQDQLDALLGEEDILVTRDTPWKVHFRPEPVEAGWSGTDFDDNEWVQTGAPVGFPPDQANGGFLPPAFPTSHLRHTATLDIEAYHQFTLRMRYADAASVWVNGERVITTPGLGVVVTESTLSTIDRPGIPSEFEDFVIPMEHLVPGPNVFAVQIHQGPHYDSTNPFDVANDQYFEAEIIGQKGVGAIEEFNLEVRAGRSSVSRLVKVVEVAGPSFFQTVGGELQEGQHHVWSGRILVAESVILPATSTLTISPGTLIRVAPDAGVDVHGVLNAQGTESAPILWEPSETDLRWRSLHIVNGGSIEMVHAFISGAQDGLTVEEGTLTFTHGHIESNVAIRQLGGSGPTLIQESTIESFPGGIENHGEMTLIGNTILTGVLALDGETTITDTVITSSVEGVHSAASVSLTGSRITGDGLAGVRVVGGTVAIDHTIIHGFSTGVQVERGTLSGNHLTLVGTNGFDLGTEVDVSVAASILDTETTVLGNGDALDTSALFLDAPLFVNAASSDFHLQSHSPARGAGPAGVDMGALPYQEAESIGGTIHWRAEDGPFHLVDDATVPEGSLLQIDPGVSVYADPGVRLTVLGTIQALGTEYAPVRFSEHPEAADEDDPLLPGMQMGPPKWGGIRIVDSLSPDNIIQHAVFVNAQPTDNQGSIGVIRSECFIEHCTFSGTHYRMIYGRNCSLTVQHCIFPDMFAEDESPVALRLDNVAEQLKVESPAVPDDPRFVGGFPVNGHFRVYHNHFYGNKGHNDVFDADSGRWGESTVLDCRYNHFHGPVGDEHIDLGGDAYIAFNVFENVRKDEFTSDRGYANAISTGDRGSGTTIVVTGNVFRNVEHAINCKLGTGTIFEFNDCLDFPQDYRYEVGNIQQDVRCAAVNLFVPEDFAPTPGDGAYLGYNVFYGSASSGIFNQTGFPRLISWADLDQPNRPDRTSQIQIDHNLIDPQLEDPEIGSQHPGGIFDERWGMGNLSGEPETRFASNGLPMGASIREWAHLTGGPLSRSAETHATFQVGGPGIFAYRWRLNDGPWSDPVSIAPGRFLRDAPTVRWSTLVLEDLVEGNQRLEVLGQDFAGNWQPEEDVTVREWAIQPNSTDIVLHELRTVGEDAVELHNRGLAADLTGWQLAESLTDENPYIFPEGSTLEARGYLVVTEVTLDRDGDALFLLDPNGEPVDEIRFGYQPAGYTLGRLGGAWTLTVPTLGAANVKQPLGSAEEVRITEILAATDKRFREDWIELYNDSSLPVALADWRLTDNPEGDPEAHRFPPHTYLAGKTFWKLIADGSSADGHVDFALDANGESLALISPDGQIREIVLLSPQTQDTSQAWTFDGASFFPEFPTDGFAATAEAMVQALLLMDHLRISELHYNPIDGSEEEFVELINTGEVAIPLEGVRFTRGIEFIFPEWMLEPGSRVLIVRNRAIVEARHGTTLPIAGEYTGKLDNSGETLTLTLPEPFGAAILDFRYEPIAMEGHSLEALDLDLPLWQSGKAPHGTPGGQNAQDGGGGDPSPTEKEALLQYALGDRAAFSASPNALVLSLGDPPADVAYVIEASSDLLTWDAIVERPAGSPWPDFVSVAAVPEGGEQVTVLLQQQDAIYFRLRVSRE